eukprot:CCRYP_008183-RA/>CCRYP_008183-RA protein AED:0.20 eAED:0.05 QI:0/0/0/0.66/1/1/6/0/1274
MTTPEEAKTLFNDLAATYTIIVGQPTDDDVKHLRESITNLLQSIDVPGGTCSLSGLIDTEATYIASHGAPFDPMTVPLLPTILPSQSTPPTPSELTPSAPGRRNGNSSTSSTPSSAMAGSPSSTSWRKHGSCRSRATPPFTTRWLSATCSTTSPRTCPALKRRTSSLCPSTCRVGGRTTPGSPTGSFPKQRTDWDSLPPASKTWAAWKTWVQTAQQMVKHEQRATNAMADVFGSASVSIVYHQTTPAPQAFAGSALGLSFQEQFSSGMDALALAATNDKTVLDNLVATNKMLSDSVAKKLAKIESLFAKNPTNTSTLTSGSTNDARLVAQLKAAIKGKWAMGRFCSSHGYGISADHTSASCKNKKPVTNLNPSAPAATVSDAAGKQHCSSAQAEILLDLPDRTAKIMPSFQHNLMGIGKLCNNNCRVVFDKTTVTVFANDGSTLLQGWREQHGAKLWRFSLIPNQQVSPDWASQAPLALNARDLPSVGALVHYLHAAAGFPVKATWLAAIKAGNYASWPSLTHANASKYWRRNHQGAPHAASKELHLWDEPISKLFTDDMGRFPVRSRSGNQYLMLAYHCDTNAILVEPFQSRHDRHRIPAYNKLMGRLTARTHTVDHQVLDNEASAEYRWVITEDWNCSYQLVPPNVHRRNIAECTIQTFKVHFLSILAGLPSAFPNYLWDMLIPQTKLTLNLLRQAHTAPAISAWEAYNNAPFNFDATPIGPCGCPVIIHNKSNKRLSWAFCGHKGFSIGPALEHYRCFQVVDSLTKALVISDTYKDLWSSSYAKELGRLCQGFTGTNPTRKPVDGTNTFHVINFSNIPPDRLKEVCYSNVVCKVRPEKDDPDRTQITIAGNHICYPGDVGTKTAPLELVKLMINSVLSRQGAKFCTFDISNFYLQTPLDHPEYIKIKITDIPQAFINEYNLFQHVHNDWVYFEIRKGIYSLPQSGILAQKLLAERLAKKGYYQCKCTPGLWRHKWRPIMFTLIVDGFGVEYLGEHHAHHLRDTIKEFYDLTENWKGDLYAGINLAWNYSTRTCRLSMEDYINTVLTKYNHQRPKQPVLSPYKSAPIIYGTKVQYTDEADTSPALGVLGIKRIQGIVGTLLYYARAVDNKLLHALSEICTQQATATDATNSQLNHLLDYCATYPNDGILYRASNMILPAHSDATYLNASKAHSRAGTHIMLSEDDPVPSYNGPILTLAQIIKFVASSAAEAELAGLYICAKQMVPLCNSLEEMGWPQPKSPIQTNNTTALGVANKTIITKKMKSMDMHLCSP